MPDLGKGYVQIVPSAKGIKGAISNVLDPEGKSAGETAGTNFADSFKSLAKKAIVGLGLGKIIKDSLLAGGDLQQSFGGLDTIYSKAADAAKSFATSAAAAGISANTYAEQAVGMGAALKQAFGGDVTKAAESANMAIMDMADNAAKMGTPIESLQNAYQGFAKGNYTMLDNLKIGFGGTRSEMERLLAKATELTGVKYDINNLGDVYSAIHEIQNGLGLTGVAAEEAKTTLTGSFNAVKASAENLLASLSLGMDIGPRIQQLGASVSDFFFGNLLPMLGNIVTSVPELISGIFNTAIPILTEQIGAMLTDAQVLLTETLPAILTEAAQTFVNAVPEFITRGQELITGLWSGMNVAVPQIWATFTETNNAIISIITSVDWLGLGSSVIQSITDGIIALFGAIPEVMEQIGTFAFGQVAAIDWFGLGLGIIQLAADGITAIFNAIPDLVLSIAQTAWNLFAQVDWLQLGTDVIDFVFDGIDVVFGMIPDIITAIGTTAWNLFHELDWFGLGTAVIDFIVNAITAIFNNIPDTLNSIGTTAWEWMHSIDWMGLGADVITFIGDGIRWLFDTIPGALSEIGTSAWNAFCSIDWLGLGVDVISTISGGIDGVFNLIVDALGAIGSAALDGFLNLSWVQTGTDIVNGIVQGLRNAAGAVGSFLMQMARDALRSVKNFFGISSPSKLMEKEVGHWLPPGIGVGVEKNKKPFIDALEGLADDAVEVNPMRTINQWSYSSWTPVPTTVSTTDRPNVTININADDDRAEEIADRVLDRLDDEYGREERIYGTV